MPEVYTKENILRNESLGKSKNNRKKLLTEDEVRQLRQ
jgi:hypothetical protein